MNLLIIGILFYVIRCCVARLFLSGQFYLSELAFAVLCISTISIAAGGYVINDYFDRDIDAVNRPEKQAIGKDFPPSAAINLHVILSLTGFLFGAAVAISFEIYSLLLIQFATIGLLFLYAFKLKRLGLIGNVVVALLVGIVPMIAGFYEFIDPYMELPMSILYAFAGFAFLFTLIRELIKDLEDMEGDEKFGCRTLPIRWGIKKTTILIACLLLMVIGSIGYAQYFAYQLGDMVTIYYFLALVQLPTLFLVFKILRSKKRKDFHFASQFIKAIMLFGICYGALLYYLN